MSQTGTLIRCDEAHCHVENIADPVTRNLVNMAFVSLVQSAHLDRKDQPTCDLDMLFLVRSLEHFFAEHEVLMRTLNGQIVGAWFENGAG